MRHLPPGVEAPTWSTAREALRVIAHPAYLRVNLALTVVVGSLLFAINQLDVVLRGDATPVVWIKVLATYLVPFGVSNFGVLIATRSRP